MKWCFFWLAGISIFFVEAADYCLIQEDFVKFGKKELYETEKKQDLQTLQKKIKNFRVCVVEDLENPQFALFMPIEDLSKLSLYLPTTRNEGPLRGQNLLETSLSFSLFSLHRVLEKASLHPENLEKMRPYWVYLLYDVTPGYEDFLEQHLEKIAYKNRDSAYCWKVWKTLLGADVPKLLLCVGFATKEEMKEAEVENLFQESTFREVLRGKKQGWGRVVSDFMTSGAK